MLGHFSSCLQLCRLSTHTGLCQGSRVMPLHPWSQGWAGGYGLQLGWEQSPGARKGEGGAAESQGLLCPGVPKPVCAQLSRAFQASVVKGAPRSSTKVLCCLSPAPCPALPGTLGSAVPFGWPSSHTGSRASPDSPSRGAQVLWGVLRGSGAAGILRWHLPVYLC